MDEKLKKLEEALIKQTTIVSNSMPKEQRCKFALENPILNLLRMNTRNIDVPNVFVAEWSKIIRRRGLSIYLKIIDDRNKKCSLAKENFNAFLELLESGEKASLFIEKKDYKCKPKERF